MEITVTELDKYIGVSIETGNFGDQILFDKESRQDADSMVDMLEQAYHAGRHGELMEISNEQG